MSCMGGESGDGRSLSLRGLHLGTWLTTENELCHPTMVWGRCLTAAFLVVSTSLGHK